jgi:hypothetical protein
VALNNAALNVAGTSVRAAITHLQLHSAASGPNWTTNVIGTRVAVSTRSPSPGSCSAA